MSRSFSRSRLAAVVAVALALGLALTPALAKKKAPQTSPKIHAVVVTSVDPDEVLQASAKQYKKGPFPLGPFRAHDTVNLYVVSVYDRRGVSGPFDQVTKFVLPDGSNYETRTMPVDPAGLPNATVRRAELAPHPVPVEKTPRMKRLARSLPPGTLTGKEARDATYTRVVLPVSGTWITQHNLYGKWTVEVSMVQNGDTVATANTTFTIGLGR
ncbi:MAG: hypothetical protein KBD01_00960 [Acidobacteria bacterium]|nr:hypothetical protein [Acidobacteriota bacterium]